MFSGELELYDPTEWEYVRVELDCESGYVSIGKEVVWLEYVVFKELVELQGYIGAFFGVKMKR